MTDYIHDHDDWPVFRWDRDRLAPKLAEVRNRQGRLTGRMEALGFDLKEHAVLATLTEEVVKTSEIEGETLDQDQVRSSLARRLGMDVGGLTPAERDVEGVVEMMLDATQNFTAPLTAERLFGWHAALFPAGRSGLKKIGTGRWRDEAAGPMQVVSGPAGRERVHFEAPAAARLPGEMAAFLDWFNAEPVIDPVLKAAVAHLWFVTVHPFEDGNGRIARAIADMALARSENSPRRFYSMSAQIREDRAEYHNVLEWTQKGDPDITRWLEWFLACLDRAFGRADITLAAVLRKARFWQVHLDETFSDRQRKVLNRLLDGFDGKLTSSKWAAITRTSQDTASRDIDDLLRRRVLIRQAGGGRSTSYMLVVAAADALRAAAAYARTHAAILVTDGPTRPTADDIEHRRQAVLQVAERIDALAEISLHEPISYRQFEALLELIRQQGGTIADDLVSAVAFAINRDGKKPVPLVNS